jgi:hypothetical protein
MNNGIVALGPLMWESTATSATKLQKKYQTCRITQHYDAQNRNHTTYSLSNTLKPLIMGVWVLKWTDCERIGLTKSSRFVAPSLACHQNPRFPSQGTVSW